MVRIGIGGERGDMSTLLQRMQLYGCDVRDPEAGWDEDVSDAVVELIEAADELVKACDRVGDRGMELSAPKVRAALARFSAPQQEDTGAIDERAARIQEAQGNYGDAEAIRRNAARRRAAAPQQEDT